MQYSDLFWCGRGDSPSRALKTVRRTVFARRDADGGHRLFESTLAASCTISYKIKRAASEKMLLLVRPGGFEPLAFGVGVQRSIQLSYDRTCMKIVAGTRFIV